MERILRKVGPTDVQKPVRLTTKTKNVRVGKEEIFCSPPFLIRLYFSFPPFFPFVILCPAFLVPNLLWSDPEKNVTGWSEDDHEVSLAFGPDVVFWFLQKHDLDLICRVHQVRVPPLHPGPSRSPHFPHFPKKKTIM